LETFSFRSELVTNLLSNTIKDIYIHLTFAIFTQLFMVSFNSRERWQNNSSKFWESSSWEVGCIFQSLERMNWSGLSSSARAAPVSECLRDWRFQRLYFFTDCFKVQPAHSSREVEGFVSCCQWHLCILSKQCRHHMSFAYCITRGISQSMMFFLAHTYQSYLMSSLLIMQFSLHLSIIGLLLISHHMFSNKPGPSHHSWMVK
jgi:hypothetical protein